MQKTFNPTDNIDVGFDSFVKSKQDVHDANLEGGIPNYAFASDYAIRKKIMAIPGVFPFFKAVTNTVVPFMKQQFNMNGLRVGPTQYSNIYNMTVECAGVLGIGVPSVYILNVPGVMNAMTVATDDEAPLIILFSGLVERLTEGELKSVIGHECGHIHNNHGVFNIAVSALINKGFHVPMAAQIMSLAFIPLRYLLQAWSRAGEVTCDRAGIICSDDKMDKSRASAKLMSGGMLGMEEANLDAIIKQYDMLRKTPVRLLELTRTHPLSIRRILANQEFINSEILYKWRPEWREPGMNLTDKKELDARTGKYISIIKNKEANKHG